MSPTVPNAPRSIYFGYGSNMWLDQMNRRCPENKFIGIGSLQNWRWIICQPGYANVVPLEGHTVYGCMYELSQTDEAILDGYEGVPHNYVKKILPVDFFARDENGVPAEESITVEALVYVDVQRVLDGQPRHEYIHRMNMAIADGIKAGIPVDYMEKVLRPFIPVEE